MPDYVVTGPDGKKYNVTAPAGATQQQIVDRVKKQATPAEPKSTAPEGLLGAPQRYWETLTSRYQETREAGAKAFTEGATGILQSRDWTGRALSALEFIGGAYEYTLSPIIAFGKTEAKGLVGDPLQRRIEAVTGKPHPEISKYAEEIGGDIAGVAGGVVADPILGAAKAVGAMAKFAPARAVIKAVAPQAVNPQARLMSQIIRPYRAAYQLERKRTQTDLETYRAALNKMPDQARFDFVEAYETGTYRGVPQEMQPVAQKLHDMLLEKVKRVQSLGVGALEHVFNNDKFFAHYWKDPAPDVTKAMEFYEKQLASRGGLKGPQTFKRKRTFMTLKEGMDAGLTPASSDPIQLMIWKMDELDKFYFGTKAEQEIKATGIAKFVNYGTRAPFGWKALDDRAFRAILPPFRAMIPEINELKTIMHEWGIDPGLQEGLQRVADRAGLTLKTPLRSEDPELKGAYGYTYPPTSAKAGEVTTAYGMPQTTTEHEIGHNLDWRWGLSAKLYGVPKAWRELGELALYRFSDADRGAAKQAPDYLRYLDAHYPYFPGQPPLHYLLSSEERIANMLHAYWYVPDTFRQVAPTAARWFDNFLNSLGPDPVARAVKDVKPSLRTETMPPKIETVKFHVPAQEIKAPGMRHLGQWYAPDAAATVFNNYVSRGLSGRSSLFDAIRKSGNALTMYQLGLSAYHAGFVTLDSMTSRFALGLEQAGRGEFGRGVENILGSMTPFATAQAWRKGDKIIKAALNPKGATPDLLKAVEHLVLGGGRLEMDQFYSAADRGGLIKSLRDGSLMRQVKDQFATHPYRAVLGLPFKIATKAMEDASHWLMHGMVPRVKLGVFSDMAADWIRAHPAASAAEVRAEMQIISDAVDDRLGQMVYDNIFWNKTAKDLAFLSVRSVGWNLGTMRIGGKAMVDASRALYSIRTGDVPAFTRHIAYAAAMPIIPGFYGALIYYAFHGKPPETIKDYFFPRTGKLTPKGDEERLMLPSYLKDILEYNQAPIQTLENKVNPLWSFALQMIVDNKDFYGGIIRDPEADPATQAQQLGGYLAEQFKPFSLRAMQRLKAEGQDPFGMALSFFGIQPAPGYITAPERVRRAQRREERKAIRKRRKQESRTPGILESLFGGGEK
jgi:hypothetical protein